MGLTVLLLLARLALAVIVFVATGGHLLLPIFLVVPLGLLVFGRRRR